TSTRSMMPTIAASTGAPFRPSASPAARPSSTISTFSCIPAPTESTASNVTPRGWSSTVSGWTSSSLPASNARCFCVATTVPTTRAICMSVARPVIDDAHDPGVGRHLGGMKRKTGFLSAYEEHGLAHTGPDGVDGHDGSPDRRAIGANRLQDEQLHAHQVLVLARGHDVSEDLGELHVQPIHDS